MDSSSLSDHIDTTHSIGLVPWFGRRIAEADRLKMIHLVAFLGLLVIRFALFFAIVMFCLATITTFGFGISRLATSIGIGCCLAFPLVSLVFLVARI